jgi:hypothetical protein
MMHPGDFVLFVRGATRNRQVLARIALNVLFDPDAYPVDLSEIQALDHRDRDAVNSLLVCSVTEPLTRVQDRSENFQWLKSAAQGTPEGAS